MYCVLSRDAAGPNLESPRWIPAVALNFDKRRPEVVWRLSIAPPAVTSRTLVASRRNCMDGCTHERAHESMRPMIMQLAIDEWVYNRMVLSSIVTEQTDRFAHVKKKKGLNCVTS